MTATIPDPTELKEVYRYLLSHFARTGQPPSNATLAQGLNISRETAEAALGIIEEQGNIYRDPTTREIIAAYPFSARLTDHVVRFPDEHRVYAMCAIDALGIPAMLDTDATIESRCARCGKAIHVEVQHNTLRRYEPRDAQVWYLAVDDCCIPALEQCPSINFFCSAEHLAAWRAKHSDTHGDQLTIEEALVRGVAVFGSLLKGKEDGPSL